MSNTETGREGALDRLIQDMRDIWRYISWEGIIVLTSQCWDWRCGVLEGGLAHKKQTLPGTLEKDYT